MKQFVFILVCVTIFISCKKNTAQRQQTVNDNNWKWSQFYSINDPHYCGVTWKDTFFTSYPSNHPAASKLVDMFAGYYTDYALPQDTTATGFKLNSRSLGFADISDYLQFSINGTIATTNWNASMLTFSHNNVVHTLRNVSMAVTAEILSISPVRVKFDMKINSGTIDNVDLGNSVHFIVEKTFFGKIDCCPGNNLTLMGATYSGLLDVYLIYDSTSDVSVKLFSVPDTLSLYSYQRGYPTLHNDLTIEGLIFTNSQSPFGSLSCDYYFTPSSGWGMNVKVNDQIHFPEIHDGNVYLYYGANYLRNDTLYLNYPISGILKTTDPVIISKGVDTSYPGNFLVRAALKRI